jgi:hypothetical protein
MTEVIYVIPETTVYRRVYEELVTIQLQSGDFFYFNPEAEEFFEFFREPRPLSQFCDLRRLPSSEREYLKSFCSILVESGLISTSIAGAREGAVSLPVDYIRPALIRRGEEKLDEVAFLHV